ncbi:MAG: CpsD/CapB family tyrosine-protein kinase [Anaerolineae bacterium]
MAESIGLVTITDPTSPASEAYRSLRMNLQFSSLDKPIHTLLITSPMSGEGKTTTLANLAVTLAQIDQRVTVVDCDLRRPALHTLFGLTNEKGFSNMVLEEQALENPPYQETEVNGLRIITSGPLPPRPGDILGSKKMEKILERLVADADIVILDAPPVMTVTDAAILATKVDGVLLVLSAGETKRDQAQRSVERLQKVNAHILGTVLNNAPLDASLSGSY